MEDHNQQSQQQDNNKNSTGALDQDDGGDDYEDDDDDDDDGNERERSESENENINENENEKGTISSITTNPGDVAVNKQERSRNNKEEEEADYAVAGIVEYTNKPGAFSVTPSSTDAASSSDNNSDTNNTGTTTTTTTTCRAEWDQREHWIQQQFESEKKRKMKNKNKKTDSISSSSKSPSTTTTTTTSSSYASKISSQKNNDIDEGDGTATTNKLPAAAAAVVAVASTSTSTSTSTILVDDDGTAMVTAAVLVARAVIENEEQLTERIKRLEEDLVDQQKQQQEQQQQQQSDEANNNINNNDNNNNNAAIGAATIVHAEPIDDDSTITEQQQQQQQQQHLGTKKKKKCNRCVRITGIVIIVIVIAIISIVSGVLILGRGINIGVNIGANDNDNDNDTTSNVNFICPIRCNDQCGPNATDCSDSGSGSCTPFQFKVDIDTQQQQQQQQQQQYKNKNKNEIDSDIYNTSAFLPYGSSGDSGYQHYFYVTIHSFIWNMVVHGNDGAGIQTNCKGDQFFLEVLGNTDNVKYACNPASITDGGGADWISAHDTGQCYKENRGIRGGLYENYSCGWWRGYNNGIDASIVAAWDDVFGGDDNDTSLYKSNALTVLSNCTNCVSSDAGSKHTYEDATPQPNEWFIGAISPWVCVNDDNNDNFVEWTGNATTNCYCDFTPWDKPKGNVPNWNIRFLYCGFYGTNNLNCDLLRFTDCTFQDDGVTKKDCTSVTITNKGFDFSIGRFR